MPLTCSSQLGEGRGGVVQRRRKKARFASLSILVPAAALGWLLVKGSVFQTLFAVESKGLVAARVCQVPAQQRHDGQTGEAVL